MVQTASLISVTGLLVFGTVSSILSKVGALSANAMLQINVQCHGTSLRRMTPSDGPSNKAAGLGVQPQPIIVTEEHAIWVASFFAPDSSARVSIRETVIPTTGGWQTPHSPVN